MARDPKRLVEEFSDDEALRNALRERPALDLQLSDKARRRIQRRVAASIAAGGAAGAVTESARAAAGSTTAGSTTATGGLSGLPLTVVHWLGAIAVGGAVSTGIWALTSTPEQPAVLPKAPAPSRELLPTGEDSEVTPQAAKSTPTVTLRDLPLEPEVIPAKKEERAPRASASATLAEEVRLIKEARTALQTNPQESLRILKSYRVRFPQGQLDRDAHRLTQRAERSLSSSETEAQDSLSAREE